MGLLALGAGLLGGILNNRSQRKAQDRANAYADPQKVRDRAEAAGFNPLTMIGNVNPGNQQTNFQPTMGSLIQNAVSAYQSNNVDQEQLEIQRAELDLERDRLNETINRQTLRPVNPNPSGGIFTGSPNGPLTASTPSTGHTTRDFVDGTGRNVREVTHKVTGERQYIDLDSGRVMRPVNATFMLQGDQGGVTSGVGLEPETFEFDGAAFGLANIAGAGLEGVTHTPSVQNTLLQSVPSWMVPSSLKPLVPAAPAATPPASAPASTRNTRNQPVGPGPLNPGQQPPSNAVIAPQPPIMVSPSIQVGPRSNWVNPTRNQI